MSWRACVTAAIVGAGCLGCAARKPFDTAALKSTKPRSLLLVVRKPGPFLVRSPTPVYGSGVPGYLVARRLRDLQDGKELTKTAGLSDPAGAIGKELTDELAARLGVTTSTVVMPVEVDPTEASDDAPAELVDAGRADLILFLRTTSWSLMPHTAEETIIPAMYYTSEIHLELVDARGERRTLASGDCETGHDGHTSKTTYEDMVDARATRLRELIERSIERCTDQFKSILFGGPAAAPGAPPRSQ